MSVGLFLCKIKRVLPRWEFCSIVNITNMPKTVLNISNLSKTYSGGFEALKNVSLEIEQGEIFGLLGPNGAGKTTLINIIAGLTKKTSGQALVLSKDVERDYRFTRAKIGVVQQELNTDPSFTVEEVVKYQAGYFGILHADAKVKEILKNLSLWDKRKSTGRALSGGMKRRVMIAKALVHDPEILFLDEPTAGVDIELRENLWNLVRDLQKMSKTIILTTHYLEEAEELAGRIGVINHGKLILVEEKQKLLDHHSNQNLKQIYTKIIQEDRKKIQT